MSKTKVEEVVYDLVVPIAEKNGCEVVDVEFKKEGADWYLRVFMDKENGVTIEDCEITSKKLSKVLDDVDPIKQSYYLEVSSPGVERPLKRDKDFKRFIGHKIDIKLYGTIEGEKSLTGILKEYNNGVIHLETDKKDIIDIPKDKVALANLHFEF